MRIHDVQNLKTRSRPETRMQKNRDNKEVSAAFYWEMINANCRELEILTRQSHVGRKKKKNFGYIIDNIQLNSEL